MVLGIVVTTLAYPLEYAAAKLFLGPNSGRHRQLGDRESWWSAMWRWLVLLGIGVPGLMIAVLVVSATAIGAATVMARVLAGIARSTPDGSAGVVGVTLLVFGFIGQLIGTWLYI